MYVKSLTPIAMMVLTLDLGQQLYPLLQQQAPALLNSIQSLLATSTYNLCMHYLAHKDPQTMKAALNLKQAVDNLRDYMQLIIDTAGGPRRSAVDIVASEVFGILNQDDIKANLHKSYADAYPKQAILDSLEKLLPTDANYDKPKLERLVSDMCQAHHCLSQGSTQMQAKISLADPLESLLNLVAAIAARNTQGNQGAGLTDLKLGDHLNLDNRIDTSEFDQFLALLKQYSESNYNTVNDNLTLESILSQKQADKLIDLIKNMIPDLTIFSETRSQS